MKQTIKTILPIVLSIIFLNGCSQTSSTPTPTVPKSPAKEIVAENDSVLILREVIVPREDEYDEFDVPIVAIWIKNKKTQQETKLYQTIRPTTYVIYNCDPTKFFPVSIDSIPVTEKVSIIQNDPLQIIVEGWPNRWKNHSYIIDVSSRKTLYVPSNYGYLGSTCQGYMIFKSYRSIYFREGGKDFYTILDIYDRDGNLVDSHSLKPLAIEIFKKENRDLYPSDLVE